MKPLILSVAVLFAGSAFAHGPHGGGWGGGSHAARPVHSWRAPVYRAGPRVVVAPRFVAPRVWVGPRVAYSPRLPLGAVSLYVGAQPYFYGGGTFYVAAPQGYSVVAPPIGAVINELPAGATMQFFNGLTWATLNGAWFLWDVARGAWVVVTGP